MSMLLNPFILTPAGPPPAGGDPSVYTVKHYVIALLLDGPHVKTVKHYVIAEPS